MIDVGGGQAINWGMAQYQQTANQTVSNGLLGSNATIEINNNTNRESQLNGFFDKPNATDIRALVNMEARIFYGAYIYGNVNQLGYIVDILLNGNPILPLRGRGDASGSVNEPTSNGKSYRMILNTNDVLKMRVTNIEGSSTITIASVGTFFGVEYIRGA